jgi:hypothetical protein
MASSSPEYFVGADEAAKFLQLTTRRVKDLARAGRIPAHPIGDGSRKVWRFLLSELYQHMVSRQNTKLRKWSILRVTGLVGTWSIIMAAVPAVAMEGY